MQDGETDGMQGYQPSFTKELEDGALPWTTMKDRCHSSQRIAEGSQYDLPWRSS